MGGPAFYLSTTAGGTCLETTPDGGVLNKRCGPPNNQHWTAECGEKPNIVAFRNVRTGKYLRATGGDRCSAVTTSDDKQWWFIWQYDAAGGFTIKCNDFPDAYLTSANGSHDDDNQVWVCPKQPVWSPQHCAMTWVLHEFHPEGIKPWIGGTSQGGAQNKEVAEKEEALAAKEKELAAKEREVIEKQTSIDQDHKRSGEREAEILAREQKLNEQSSASSKELERLKVDSETAKQEVGRLRKLLADALKNPVGTIFGTRSKSGPGVDPEELKRVTEDNVDLRKQLSDAQKDLAAAAATEEKQTKDLAELGVQKEDNARLRDQLADARKASEAAASKNSQCNHADELAGLKNDSARLQGENARLCEQLADAQKASAASASKDGQEPDTGRLTQLGEDNARLRKQLTDAQKAQATATSSGPTVDPAALAKLKEDNDRLRNFIVEQAMKSNGSQSSGQSPTTNGATQPSVASGPPTAVTKGSTHSSSTNGSPVTTTRSSTKPTPSKNNPTAANTEPTNANTSRPLGQGTKSNANSSTSPQAKSASTKPGKTTSGDKPPLRKSVLAKPADDVAVWHDEAQHNSPEAAAGSSKAQPTRTAASKTSQTSTGVKPQRTKSTPNKPREVEQLKKENAALKKAAEEAHKNAMGLTAKANVGNANKKPIAGPNSNKTSGTKENNPDEDAIVFKCGHVVHPPPRKLERRMIGIMYE